MTSTTMKYTSEETETEGQKQTTQPVSQCKSFVQKHGAFDKIKDKIGTGQDSISIFNIKFVSQTSKQIFRHDCEIRYVTVRGFFG